MTTRVLPYGEGGSDGLTAEEESLFTAIAFGKLHKVNKLLPLLRHQEIRDDFSSTPLIHTARHARGEHIKFLVKLLLQNGSDANAQDDAGMTSLMHLTRPGGSVDAVRTLMRCRQCDPDVRDKHGNTALMYAAKFGNADALSILLFLPSAARHADVNARNNEGLTALDFAVNGGHDSCCRVLVDEANADTSSVRNVEKLNKLLSRALTPPPLPDNSPD